MCTFVPNIHVHMWMILAYKQNKVKVLTDSLIVPQCITELDAVIMQRETTS